jgi:hypothetical protein
MKEEAGAALDRSPAFTEVACCKVGKHERVR